MKVWAWPGERANSAGTTWSWVIGAVEGAGGTKATEGGTLADRIEKLGRPGVRDTAELMVKLARAVHHAHQRGILHRDIKPSNLMAVASGGRPATIAESAQAIRTTGTDSPGAPLVNEPLKEPAQSRRLRRRQVADPVGEHPRGHVGVEYLDGVAHRLRLELGLELGLDFTLTFTHGLGLGLELWFNDAVGLRVSWPLAHRRL